MERDILINPICEEYYRKYQSLDPKGKGPSRLSLQRAMQERAVPLGSDHFLRRQWEALRQRYPDPPANDDVPQRHVSHQSLVVTVPDEMLERIERLEAEHRTFMPALGTLKADLAYVMQQMQEQSDRLLFLAKQVGALEEDVRILRRLRERLTTDKIAWDTFVSMHRTHSTWTSMKPLYNEVAEWTGHDPWPVSQ